MLLPQVLPLITVYILTFLAGALSLCDDGTLAVDISDGRVSSDGSVIFENVTYGPSDYFEENGVRLGCVCEVKACIRKCCQDNEYLVNKTCQPTNVSVEFGDFYRVFGASCRKPIRLLLDPYNELENFTLEGDGRLYVPSNGMHYGLSDYCVDYIQDEYYLKALICSEDESVTSSYSIGKNDRSPLGSLLSH